MPQNRTQAASTCAMCGRDLREADEPRQSGGSWYCSAYCAFYDEVTRSAKSAPGTARPPRHRRRVGRVLKFAIGFVVVMVAAFVAVVVIDSRVTSPVALGQTETFGEWTVGVWKVDWNMGGAPYHAQNISVLVALHYLGGGDAEPPLWFYVEGEHHVLYGNPYSAPVAVPQQVTDTMYSDAQQVFPLMFTVATNDLRTLRLDVAPFSSKATPVQFALQAR